MPLYTPPGYLAGPRPISLATVQLYCAEAASSFHDAAILTFDCDETHAHNADVLGRRFVAAAGAVRSSLSLPPEI